MSQATDNFPVYMKTMTNADNWQANFEILKAHVAQTGHFPNKHTRLNNWYRYQRKRMKAGTMPMEQKVLFEAPGSKSFW